MMGKKLSDLNNARSYPVLYYAKHLASGLAGYENETILIEPDALKEMLPSFVGKPVVVHHQDIELHNLEGKDGTVIESFYNELDGCAWVKMLIESDEARAAIAKGWSVSNCYLPTKAGSSGMHHNIPYDRKIENGIFKHLAIVPNPRYEEADILTPEQFNLYQKEKKDKLAMLQNAKKDKKMFKIFKNTREEVNQIDEDTMLDTGDGKVIAIKDMINAVQTAEAIQKSKQNALEIKVKVGNEEMTVADLVAKYNATCKNAKKKGKKNEDDDDIDDIDDIDDKDDMDNADDDEAEKDKAKDKEKDKENALENALENAKKLADEAAEKLENFKKLMNASNGGNAALVGPKIESTTDKLDRGVARYGSGSK